MIRELRYIVIKHSDIDRYLDREDTALLVALCDKITLGRWRDGREPLQCVVVEHDWPEYEPTWAAIETRVDQEGETK